MLLLDSRVVAAEVVSTRKGYHLLCTLKIMNISWNSSRNKLTFLHNNWHIYETQFCL